MTSILLLKNPVALKSLAFCTLVSLMSGAAQGVILDDFSGNLSDFSNVVILDDNGGAANSSAWAIVGGELSLETTAFDGIEQHAFIYNGASLQIGQELRADISSIPITGNRNFGLYVGGTAPTPGIRQDYISVYGGTNANIASRGFDGTSEYNNPQADGSTADMLFIARTGENTFDAGFYDSTGRVVLTTRTPTTPNSADFLGFYADVREAGIIGFGDNLEIFPDVVFDPADVNEDSFVDENDYFIIRDNLFETEISGVPVSKSTGDIVPNGIVDLADFRLWKDSASPAAIAAAGLSVPEPSGLFLAVFGMVALAGRVCTRC